MGLDLTPGQAIDLQQPSRNPVPRALESRREALATGVARSWSRSGMGLATSGDTKSCAAAFEEAPAGRRRRTWTARWHARAPRDTAVALVGLPFWRAARCRLGELDADPALRAHPAGHGTSVSALDGGPRIPGGGGVSMGMCSMIPILIGSWTTGLSTSIRTSSTPEAKTPAPAYSACSSPAPRGTSASTCRSSRESSETCGIERRCPHL
jgi:hypothetical protein